MGARDYIRDNDGNWVEITDRVNHRDPQPLTERAEEGAVGFGSLIIDDRDLSIEIDPFTQFVRIEDDSESEDKVVSAGMLTGRKVVRTAGSSRDPIGRFWVCDFVDANERWHRRVFKGTDANRGEETDNERVDWILEQMEDWGLLDDITTYVASGAESGDLDASDLRRRYPDDAMGAAAERRSKNWWIQRQGDIGSLSEVAWWGKSGLTAYSSPLFLTNDILEIGPRVSLIRDGTSLVWPLRMDNGLRCIPDRMYSGAAARHRSGGIYRRANGSGGLPDTVSIIGVRDVVMAGTEQLTKASTINRANRYLTDMGEEEFRVEGRVRLPRGKVTQLRAGMRVPVKMTHWPFGFDDWNWFRVVSCSPAPAAAGPWYDLDIELVSTGDAADGPPEPPYEGDAIAVLLGNIGGNSTPSRQATHTGDSPPGGWAGLASAGGLTPASGTEATITNDSGSPMIVRASGDAWVNTVITGPASFTVRLLRNGSPVGGASETVNKTPTGVEGWVQQVVFDWPGIEIEDGDELQLEGIPTNFQNVGGWGGFGTDPWRGHLIVGRGTHSIPQGVFAGTWVGP